MKPGGGSERPTDAWIRERQGGALRELRKAVSATDSVRNREGFGWRVRPAAGSVVASPRFAAWDPEPDYFHHWVRDGAIAMRILPEIIALSDPDTRGWWERAFRDHVSFSLRISDPDRRGPVRNPLTTSTRGSHLEFLRPDAELRSLGGEDWLSEPRFAADGGPDLERWSRPQHDGPALRASACLRVIGMLPKLAGADVDRLLQRDLEFVRRVAGRPCIGPWEEAPARRTTFTLITQWDALDRGSRWRKSRGDVEAAIRLRAVAHWLREKVMEAMDDDIWRESLEAPPGHVDTATVLAILHCDRNSGPFALDAPATRGTVRALEREFADLYPINEGRSAPAIGRWKDDSFFGGNPWYPATLGFAELHYKLAALTGASDYDKAEAWMALIEEVAPDGDALPEQFDRASGEPVSCLALTWSAAAFIGAATARQVALPAPSAR